MEFDYDFFEKCILGILKDRFYTEENQIGVDLSDTEGVKVIFDGYGETDDGQDNEDMLSFAVFIHRDSGREGFVFPEHESAWGMIVHRPREEICIYAWYDAENDSWDIIPKDDYHDDFPEEMFMEVLQRIWEANATYWTEEPEED